uniref:Retrotransposon gag domain-containing protein n=1 Tax=Ananas comosus var. bracteatus TaxID=296719 RepID=A0A6V7NU40_ANACO|nr:unnamed protein product [Ananas comosus var. bracteatus]
MTDRVFAFQGLMSPRRYTRRSTPAPTPEVPEQGEPSMTDRLQAQVTAPTDVVQRQESGFERLQELLERQAAAAAAMATDVRDVPAPSARVPEPAEGEGIAAVLVAARPPPAIVPPAVSGSATPDMTAEDVEGERALAALIKFNKFHPPNFEGEKVEPAMVESWIDSMETLFEDLRTLERDKVYLATHCLEKAAKEMFANYFPDTLKRKLKEKFCKLEQRDRSVAEYEQEFSHLIDCVLDVVKDDQDRVEWFLRGLWLGIYKAVQILKLTTFAEVFDRALWAEHGDAHVREKHELLAESKDRGKKHQGSGSSSGQTRYKKPRSTRALNRRTVERSDALYTAETTQSLAVNKAEANATSVGNRGTSFGTAREEEPHLPHRLHRRRRFRLTMEELHRWPCQRDTR